MQLGVRTGGQLEWRPRGTVVCSLRGGVAPLPLKVTCDSGQRGNRWPRREGERWAQHDPG